jgi:hypothetical protein
MQAKDLVHEEYATNYEKKADDLNVALVKDGIKKPNNGFVSFGDLSVTGSPCVSEIQEYLSLSVVSIKEPLKWHASCALTTTTIIFSHNVSAPISCSLQ